MEFTELEYWKFKSKLAAIELERMQLEFALNDVMTRKAKLFEEKMLDPSKNYRLSDENFSVTEIVSEKKDE